jgi:beta-fructofuranosidase
VLRLPDQWIWDSWVADDGDTYHLFFLQAPRALGNPARRHAGATIGHATSSELRDWTYHGTALGPSESGWDDLAVWTGSIARGDDGVWRMYYTAISTRGHELRDQRIGLAESDDLFTWRRVCGRPIAVADPRWYATLPEDVTASETWRDPFVFRDDAGLWHMLVTARDKHAARNDNGILAEATSSDMRTWSVGPPVCAPGAGFGQLEVAQVRAIDNRPVLVFTCHPQEQTAERVTASGAYCTWSVPGDSMTGSWDLTRAMPFTAEPYLFAAPLVQARDGQWVFVGFRNREPEGILSFEIIDPVPVVLRDGVLAAG